MMELAFEAIQRVIDGHYGRTHPFHDPVWRDAELGMRELKSEITRLTKQRDELVAALEEITEYEHGFCTHPEDLKEIARSALVKVKQDDTNVA
jgi:hypothetical protein